MPMYIQLHVNDKWKQIVDLVRCGRENSSRNVFCALMDVIRWKRKSCSLTVRNQSCQR